MTRTSVIPLRKKVISYVRDNWGSPFIAIFVLFLLFAVAFLSVGALAFADILADCAYFALTVGVFLQLICFLKDRKRVGDGEAL